jgi:hypothetical protein
MTPVYEEDVPAEPLRLAPNRRSDVEQDEAEWDVDIEVDLERFHLDAEEMGHA